MKNTHLFTSESVSEGHPDKVADQISDAILDAHLAGDPDARVACETLISKDLLVIAGEITAANQVDYKQVAFDTIRNIGYDGSFPGFNPDTCQVIINVRKQAPEIASGVNEAADSGETPITGAGDQGLMFGYATRETWEKIPVPLLISHNLLLRLSDLRKNGGVQWIKPDAKSQVTVKYENGAPVSVERVVLSTQHAEGVKQNVLRDFIMEEVIRKEIDSDFISSDCQFFINPTGSFVYGGPEADTGLTGRKIIADTYGGAAPHGGGAFSGKDPSKVDRSAAYMARYIAKNITAACLAEQCTVQLAYAIGVAQPLSLHVDVGPGSLATPEELLELIPQVFDLTPDGIIKTLDLKRPIYTRTAAYGHFGRDIFPWELTDEADALRYYSGLD